MKKQYIILVIVLLIILGLFVYNYYSPEKLENVGAEDECQEDHQCPEGYKCGLKIDSLPGARGKCIQ